MTTGTFQKIGDGTFKSPFRPDFGSLEIVSYAVISETADEFEVSYFSREITDIDRYWLAKAAVLDPNSCVPYFGSYDVVVPEGECWFLLSAWNTLVNGLVTTVYQRDACYSDLPLALPAGTRLADNGTPYANLWVSKPSLVAGNSGYDDPKLLYETRMGRLQTLPIQTFTLFTSAGANPNDQVQGTLPTHFDNALMIQMAQQDISWLGLFDRDTGYGLIATEEISDRHQNRIGVQLRFPFKRSVTPHLAASTACIAGDSTPGSGIAGIGTMTYVELPEDW